MNVIDDNNQFQSYAYCHILGKGPIFDCLDWEDWEENNYENIYFMILNKRVQINIIIIFNIITAIR